MTCKLERRVRGQTLAKRGQVGGYREGTHWKRQTGRPIELRDGHFEVTEVVELTQRQRAEWDDSE